MGQKVNPIGFRLGFNKTWDSRWIAGKNYATFLHQDIAIRSYVMKKLAPAGISKVVVERPAKKACVSIYTARPGVLIGKKGADIEKLKKQLALITKTDVTVNIVEIKKPELDSKLVADGIASQLERRISFRRAMKRAIDTAMRMGAVGIHVNLSGRLGGAEIARMEWNRQGRVPLHTLRADMDYGFAEALTTYGIIGVKVWVYKGDVMIQDPMARDKKMQETGGAPQRA